MKLFDAHCHLQDPRILSKTPQLIKTAQEAGVVCFAVNGVSEQDWQLVKEMSETHPSVIPCFGLHPWSFLLSFLPFCFFASSVPVVFGIKLIRLYIKELGLLYL